MISKFFHIQSKSITFSANILVVSSLISAVLGLIRNRLLAGFFGASGDTDVYLAAFRIPDLVYGIFILGGISVAFLPIFSELFEEDSKKAWAFAVNLLNILFVCLAVFSFILALAAPLLIHLVAPGFSDQQRETAIGLMRLMFLSPLFFGLASVFSGIVQYFDRFFTYALAPILYNIGIIGGIFFLTPFFGIWGAGIGVVAGALLYLLVQLPSAIHSGFRFQAVWNLKDRAMHRVFALALPRLPGALGYHINLIVMTALASTFATGSITVFGFANDLQAFPINLIGIPFAIAAFPALSRAFVKKNIEHFHSAFAASCSEIIFLALPMATALFLLRAQIIRLAYGVGKFDWQDTALTAAVLGIFTIGVLFQAMIPLFARAFFSMQNTKIPTVIGLSAIALNVLLAMAFIHVLSFENSFQQTVVSVFGLRGIQDIRVLSLPLALMLSGLFQCVFLGVFLIKKVNALFAKGFFVSVGKAFLCTFAMGLMIQVALHLFNHVFLQTFFAMAAGAVSFLLAAVAVRSPQLFSIMRSLKEQFHGK